MDTHFRSSCGSHIVHMQKIWNRSHFFQKIFPHRVYFQNFRNRSSLPKKKLPDSTYAESLQPFTLFAKNLPHRVYWQKFWKRSCFSELFSKNLSLASSGRPDIGISTILYAPIRQIRQISPLPGLFPKRHPVVLLLSEKIQKNIISHHWLSQLPPCFVTPFFNFFSKIFVSPLLTITFLPPKGHTLFRNFFKKSVTRYTSDYRIFFAFCFWCLEKVAKSSRVGIKSW